MYIAYATVAIVTIAYCAFSAGCDFVRFERVALAMNKAGVPRSWMPALGVPKAGAALGLLAGFWLPVIGPAAAAGLVLFFVCAVVTHLRVRDYSLGLQYPFLLLAAATLALGLVT
ncbi:DoxX family protein [Streptomyces sp. H10-C2]|uniref:DoxX family protein n=1 Tax=unclassified Streptomyces TaxID=2593676 RepID=UPI0024BAE2FC|nr:MULTISPECIES: DoxX family protein [unclassified Streptomyces]MDJ0343650.1 DoxX family protein [Streptomyces sp. PH10-H1]MDJ0373102.1 DoxX family protein [Streptomyces sp. H10-C2]